MENQSVITKRKNECWAGKHSRCSLQYGVGKDICAFVSQKFNYKIKNRSSLQMHLLYTSKVKIYKTVKAYSLPRILHLAT